MTLLFDSTSPVLLPSQLRHLVEAVLEASPTDETDWIEWKSYKSLETVSDLVQIARHILAFSNRDPDRAQATCSGFAYLIIGAEPGAVTGVTQLDPADLEAKLHRFLGEDGPTWSISYLDFESKSVAAFSVAPPQWGDPIRTLRSAFDKYQEGAIFVRRLGASHAANSSEIKMLERRLTRAEEQIRVAVEWLSEEPTVPIVDLTPEATHGWIEAERETLLRAEPPPVHSANSAEEEPEDTLTEEEQIRADELAKGMTFAELIELERRDEAGEALTEDERLILKQSQATIRRAFAPFAKGIATQFSPFGRETRSRSEYEEQVAEYLRECESALPAAVLAHVIEGKRAELRLAIRNDTDSNLPGVQVELRIEGRVWAAEDSSDVNGDLPAPPPQWGTPPPQPTFSIPSLARQIQSASPANVRFPAMDITNEASSQIVFKPVDIRPRSRVSLPAFHLLISASEPAKDLLVQWRATSSGVNGVASGSLHLNTQPDAVTPRETIPITDWDSSED